MRRRFEKRVYIPLPEPESIMYKLKRELGQIPNNITEDQLQEITKALDGYSMSDITGFIKQAAMTTIMKTQDATYFKQVDWQGKKGWQACKSSDQGAQKMNYMSISGDDLVPPPVEYMDMIKSLKKARKSVSPEDLIKQEEFTRDFGMEG